MEICVFCPSHGVRKVFRMGLVLELFKTFECVWFRVSDRVKLKKNACKLIQNFCYGIMRIFWRSII
jgi:hypothetical protein